MRVLAFDTAMAACSAAVWVDGVVRAARRRSLERGHAEALMPMVEAVREEAGLAYEDLDLIAVTVGPGTFTGLRIGLATARGLALATGRPLVGVTTLEAVSCAVDPATAQGAPILAALDARRGEVYAQAFAADRNPLGAPCVVDPADAVALLAGQGGVVVGSGAGLVRAACGAAARDLRFPDGAGQPDAAVVAEIAAARGAPEPYAPPSPLYLRGPDAKLPPPSRAGR